LVQAIECTDPLVGSRRKALRIEGVALGILAAFILLVLLSIKVDDGISMAVYGLIFLSVLPMVAITFLTMSDHHNAYAQPIRIYSNGLEAFSSLSDKLRGTDGFLSSSMLRGVELKDVSVDLRTRTECHSLITVELKDGRKRVIGIRSRQVAREIAMTLSFLWGLPVKDVTWAASGDGNRVSSAF
jgi:hypothetical protein